MDNTAFKSRFPELKAYALTDQNSEGRVHAENFHDEDLRCQFLHDRDRIIHSKAFRRLESKTQVVLTHESDHSRTRLTHSLEVNQIAESIALSLGLNAYATSAMALGHDVGHTPFGHTGERALSSFLTDYGLERFKHNYQGVLVVNRLEKRYNKSPGLNLMLETRDGILKHSSLKPDINIDFYDTQLSNSCEFPNSLEGQIVRLTDEIAQRTHDTDDALQTNRVDISNLVKQPLVKSALEITNIDCRDIIEGFKTDKSLVTSTVVTSLMKFYIYNTINFTKQNLISHNIKTLDDVKKTEIPIVEWDDHFKGIDNDFTKNFLKPMFYEHHEIKRMDSRADYFLKQIFKAFLNHPKQLPELTHKQFVNEVITSLKGHLKNAKGTFKTDLQNFIDKSKIECSDSCCFIPKSKYPTNEQVSNSFCPLLKHNKSSCMGVRIIANHIAGMTDRYAHLEYSRLYFPPEISRL